MADETAERGHLGNTNSILLEGTGALQDQGTDVRSKKNSGNGNMICDDDKKTKANSASVNETGNTPIKHADDRSKEKTGNDDMVCVDDKGKETNNESIDNTGTLPTKDTDAVSEETTGSDNMICVDDKEKETNNESIDNTGTLPTKDTDAVSEETTGSDNMICVDDKEKKTNSASVNEPGTTPIKHTDDGSKEKTGNDDMVCVYDKGKETNNESIDNTGTPPTKDTDAVPEETTGSDNMICVDDKEKKEDHETDDKSGQAVKNGQSTQLALTLPEEKQSTALHDHNSDKRNQTQKPEDTESLSKIIEVLKEDNKELVNKNVEIQMEKYAQTETLESFKSQIEAFGNERQKMAQEMIEKTNAHKQEMVEKTNAHKAELNNERKRTKAEIEKKDKEIKRQKEEIGKRDKNINNLKKELSDIKSEKKEVEKQNTKAEEDKKRYYHEIQKKSEQLSRANGENIFLQNKIDEAHDYQNRLVFEIRQTKETNDAKISSLKTKIQQLESEKKGLLLRLSKVASANMTYNNPNIADLSDEKRPTKLAEEFSELYDNEWTDAFEEIEGENEEDKLTFMLELLRLANQLCLDLSNGHTKKVKQSLSTLTLLIPTKQDSAGGSSVKDKLCQGEQTQYIQKNPSRVNEGCTNENERMNLDNKEKDGDEETNLGKTQTNEAEDTASTEGVEDENQPGIDKPKDNADTKDGDVDRTVTGKEQDKIGEEPDAADKCSSGSKSNPSRVNEGCTNENERMNLDNKEKDGDEETNLGKTQTNEAEDTASTEGVEDENQPGIDKPKDNADTKDGDVDRTVTGKEQDKIGEEPDAADKCSSGSKSDDAEEYHSGTTQTEQVEDTASTEDDAEENNPWTTQTEKVEDTASTEVLIPKQTTALSKASKRGHINLSANPQNADMQEKKSEDLSAFHGGELKDTQISPKSDDVQEQLSKDRDSHEKKEAIKDTRDVDTSGTSIQVVESNLRAERDDDKKKKKIQATDGSQSRTEGECLPEQKGDMSESQKKKLESDIEKLQTEQKKTVLEATKFFETPLSEDVKKTVMEIIVNEKGIDDEKQKCVVAYIEKCIDICWSMIRHKPPVHVDLPDMTCDIPFDTNKYKPYTKTGKHLAYIVWPALYLHEAGPLLAKGVAQGK